MHRIPRAKYTYFGLNHNSKDALVSTYNQLVDSRPRMIFTEGSWRCLEITKFALSKAVDQRASGIDPVDLLNEGLPGLAAVAVAAGARVAELDMKGGVPKSHEFSVSRDVQYMEMRYVHARLMAKLVLHPIELSRLVSRYGQFVAGQDELGNTWDDKSEEYISRVEEYRRRFEKDCPVAAKFLLDTREWYMASRIQAASKSRLQEKYAFKKEDIPDFVPVAIVAGHVHVPGLKRLLTESNVLS